jgi:hypothetical protein
MLKAWRMARASPGSDFPLLKTHGVCEIRHDVLLRTMPQTATRGPAGVARQAE